MQPSAKDVVMITGAARGFGAALLTAFSCKGFHVVATSRNPPASDPRPRVTWEPLDVTDATSCESVMEKVFAKFGGLGVLVNNASGYLDSACIADVSAAAIEAELAVTLRGPMILTSHYIARARAGAQRFGSVVFVASTAALPGEPGCASTSVYSAAKAGILRFAECLREDVLPLGIGAHVVVPGNMRDEESLDALMEQSAMSYAAAARAVVSLCTDDGNASMFRLDLRPARVPGA